MSNRITNLLDDDTPLPPPRHDLPVPATPAAALDVPSGVGRPHPDDAALIERLRRAVRTLDFEPLDDTQLAKQVVAWPSAAASNAIEGNPFTAADWALTRMLLEERVPMRGTIDFVTRFSRGCRPTLFIASPYRERGWPVANVTPDTRSSPLTVDVQTCRRARCNEAENWSRGRCTHCCVAGISPTERDAAEQAWRHDADRLNATERRLTAVRISGQLENGAAGPFADTPAGYKALHRHLFQDVFEWAGQPRAVNMHRADKRADGTIRRSDYIAVRFIEQGLHTAFDQIKPALPRLKVEALKVPEQRNLKLVAEIAAAHVGALNYVHAFRDGNGRAMRQRVEHLANEAGLHLDQSKLDRGKWNEGCHRINADPRDSKLLTSAIAAALAPRERVLDRERSAARGSSAHHPVLHKQPAAVERGSLPTTKRQRQPRSRNRGEQDITD